MSTTEKGARAAANDRGAAYPRHWEADVLLRDGRVAHLRPIRPDDHDLLVAFYEEVSAESKYLRFFAPMPHLSERDVTRFTTVDNRDRVAFVLTVAQRMIAVGRFDKLAGRMLMAARGDLDLTPVAVDEIVASDFRSLRVNGVPPERPYPWPAR